MDTPHPGLATRGVNFVISSDPSSGGRAEWAPCITSSIAIQRDRLWLDLVGKTPERPEPPVTPLDAAVARKELSADDKFDATIKCHQQRLERLVHIYFVSGGRCQNSVTYGRASPASRVPQHRCGPHRLTDRTAFSRGSLELDRFSSTQPFRTIDPWRQSASSGRPLGHLDKQPLVSIAEAPNLLHPAISPDYNINAHLDVRGSLTGIVCEFPADQGSLTGTPRPQNSHHTRDRRR